jgi:hypothetical protein
MLSQLSPSQGLEFRLVTDVAAKLRAFIMLGMSLQLADRHPLQFTINYFVAFVREFAEIYTVPDNWIYFNKEVSSDLAVGTT